MGRWEMYVRRETLVFVSTLSLSVVLLLQNCSVNLRQEVPPPSKVDEDLLREVDKSLGQAASYLVNAQSPDGAWRSKTYGMFKNGEALTPYVMSTLFFLDQGGIEARMAWRRGTAYLMERIDEEGSIITGPEGLLFPVLTCASASRMVVLETKDEAHRRAQAVYLERMMQYQLTEQLGWSPDDPEYGGWGFSLKPPKKSAEGELRERFFESNMVATIFGIGAMRSARMPLSDPAWEKVLTFVKRCQNFSDDPGDCDPRFDDGGFYFIPNDPLQNKAGIAGTDTSGATRFNSYGTMTADGLRALLQCGLPKDDPRVVAALEWLQRNFSAHENPGNFTEDREVLRNATYYYWAWAVAHAFTRAGVREFQQNGRTVRWAEELAGELLKRQRPDGTWANAYTDATEDDPLVATPWAAAALAICKHTMLAASDEEAGKCVKPEFPPADKHR
jgi:squalene-hopene/tetraprenyl-beta-curcumene cyclase